jgi:5'-3' exonuclease
MNITFAQPLLMLLARLTRPACDQEELDCGCRLVRDYLELEFKNAALPFAFDVERVVDDFVLFCMLIGNDFLPCECPL